jgi:hypothetical protein
MLIAGHQVDDAMFSYIASNRDADTYKLLLKDESDLSFDKSFAILQIECRHKTKSKIPSLLQHEKFLFPKAISAEQCTHEKVALFHSSLFGFNDHVLDMTMGLGVDDYYISQCVQSITAIELDKEIADIGAYNFAFLAPNVKVVNDDSVQYLRHLGDDKHFDAIFIDPARRANDGKRMFGFADCQPNVLELLPLIGHHTSRLYIKASPMLDVTQSMRDLGEHLTDVFAVSVKNECKELLFKLDFPASASVVTLNALNYDGNEWQTFSTHVNEVPTRSRTAEPEVGGYLYEPNASIMKLGCHSAVEQNFGTPMIALSSHLMVSDYLITDFPGRQFRIVEIIPFKGKEIKSLTKRYQQLNVATRNFRLSAEALKQRLRVQDGGNIYLFATTLAAGEQVIIICEKIS